MKFLKDLVKENGHKIVHYTQCIVGHRYESIFDYSVRNGGTYDSIKYYNDYIIDLG